MPAIEGQEDWRQGGWYVGQYNRSNAYVISKDSTGVVNYGGTINDASVVSYLESAKTMGLDIMFYPLLMVDMPQKPWRGHMTGGPESIDHFYQEYKKFILHYANLVKDKVDAFLIGSELKGITAIATLDKKFPFVAKLIELASEVKAILGPNVKISYAADWSEYHTADGCLRPLDDLWASKDIDFVGIDAYFPLTHSKKSNIPFQEIKDGWKSGEGIDFYFNSETKVPFKPDEKWNHWKDLAYWWYSEHWGWDDIKKASFKTAWQPQMKPIWFTEFGFPSIDKAPNKPNVFFNPKAKDGGVPTFSNGEVDFAIQRRALHATLDYWKDQSFVENMFAWCFDARGEDWTIRKQGAHPELYYYDDHELWQYGHWLDGKIVDAKKVMVGGPSQLLPLVSLHIEGNFEVEIGSDLIASNAVIVLDVPKTVLSNCALILKELIVNSLECALRGKVDLQLERFAIAAKMLKGEAIIMPSKNEYDQGEKTHIREHHETALFAHIKAQEIILNIDGRLELQASDIECARLYISAKEIDCPCIITTYTKDVAFTGSKDWATGARQSSNDHTQTQTPHPLQITATEHVYIKSDGLFAAEGMKLKTIKLHMESKDYHFTGVYLDNAHAHHHKSKGGPFSRGSVTNTASQSSIIEGVLIIAGDIAYMIAHDTIWLEAAGIVARKLNIHSDKIHLSALVGHHFHGLSIQKAHARFALTAGGGEFSLGAEMILKHHSEQHYREHAVPSVITGQEVAIKAREIEQISSEISGVRGKIDVEEWHVGIVPLYESHSSHDLNIRARMAVGIRENMSGVVHGTEHTIAAAGQLGDNAFAGVNTALAAYSTIRAATNLVQSGLISAGPMIGVDVSVSGGKMTRVSHAPNMVQFGELETSIAVPDMSVPKDMVSTSSYGISGGISNTGWNAFASVEQDGVRAGLGYSHAGGNSGVFGDEVWVIAGSGDNMLDATLASMDIGNFKQVWRDASLNSVMAQTEASVRRMIADAVTLADRVRETLGGERAPREPQLVGVYEELASTARVFVPEREDTPHVAVESDKILAELSDIVYKHNLSKIREHALALGFDRIETSADIVTKPGYFCVAFVNSKTQEVIMAHRGSDFASDQRNMLERIGAYVTDGLDDLHMGLFNIAPGQFGQAREFCDRIKSQFPNYTITQTGQSLGGVYAEGLGLICGMRTASFDSPGASVLLGSVLSMQDVERNKHLITAYKAAPNFINTTGRQLSGKIVRIEVPGCVGNLDHISYVISSLCSHKSINFVDYFSSQQVEVSDWPGGGYGHYLGSVLARRGELLWQARQHIVKDLPEPQQIEIKRQFMEWWQSDGMFSATQFNDD